MNKEEHNFTKEDSLHHILPISVFVCVWERVCLSFCVRICVNVEMQNIDVSVCVPVSECVSWELPQISPDGFYSHNRP